MGWFRNLKYVKLPGLCRHGVLYLERERDNWGGGYKCKIKSLIEIAKSNQINMSGSGEEIQASSWFTESQFILEVPFAKRDRERFKTNHLYPILFTFYIKYSCLSIDLFLYLYWFNGAKQALALTHKGVAAITVHSLWLIQLLDSLLKLLSELIRVCCKEMLCYLDTRVAACFFLGGGAKPKCVTWKNITRVSLS